MGPLRNAYLDALGIDRWVPRDAPAQTSRWPTCAAETFKTSAPASGCAGAPVLGVCCANGNHVPPSRSVQDPHANSVRCRQHRAEWLIVGEAPGAEEDRQGEPFVGRAGQLLNAMLLAIGLPRETVFIANILKCRPPGNRDPKPEEVSRCLPFLSAQIALLKPKIILAVGRIAAQNLLATDAPLARLRGKLHPSARRPPCITYHPPTC
jgi:DNA polymerase